MTLPTGSGKTRVVVEALLKWFLEKDDPPLIIWTCMTGEIGDQAEDSIRRVWNRIALDGIENKHSRSLRIHRMWHTTGWSQGEGDNIATDPILRRQGGIAICLIQTLGNIVKQDTESHKEAFEGLRDPDCLVLDEAHMFETSRYREILSQLGLEVRLNREDKTETPIIGMTATPWNRDDRNQRYLFQRYNKSFLLPNAVGKNNSPDSIRSELKQIRNKLVKEGILSRALYRPLHLGDEKVVVKQSDYDDFNRLKDSFVDKLRNNPKRNMMFIRDILDIMQNSDGKWKSMIVYSMGIHHADAIACELSLRGVKSASITGKTKARDRLSLIDQFRKGEISVLCNHSVLTVGFDAPNTDVIYVTRPVYSPIMLEQIVGRGLRGEKFGGTAECLVVTPQEMLVLEQAFGENIVLAEDEIKKRLFIED